MTNLCLFLLADRVFHPVSVRSDSVDVSLVAPVTIRAASFYTHWCTSISLNISTSFNSKPDIVSILSRQSTSYAFRI